jgi:hypothetical protein
MAVRYIHRPLLDYRGVVFKKPIEPWKSEISRIGNGGATNLIDTEGISERVKLTLCEQFKIFPL